MHPILRNVEKSRIGIQKLIMMTTTMMIKNSNARLPSIKLS